MDDGPRQRRAGAAAARRRAAPSAAGSPTHYLELVGLSEFAGAATYELSGGMQQRCQIARVLANDPAIMLLDEPFGALDALTRDRLQDELHRIWLGSGKTAFFITHSVEEAVYLGTRVLVMSPRPGRIVLDEQVPFDAGARTAELRATPAFVAFRERDRGDDRAGLSRASRAAASCSTASTIGVSPLISRKVVPARRRLVEHGGERRGDVVAGDLAVAAWRCGPGPCRARS